jgi:hypothetical protein
MPNAVIVLPYIYQPYFEACKKTLDLPAKILTIDNTQDNKGVAESWNKGIDHIKHIGADWLIICSATMRFGKGGVDMLEQIEKHPYARIIHFAKVNVPEQNYAGADSPPYDAGVFYWHCTAVRRDVFERIGYFDPNFYPIYFEDTDFDLRFNKAYANDPQRYILPISATSAGLRHGVEKAGLKVNSEPGIAYFATKWGRHPSAPQLGEYDTPFNDPENSLAFFPPAQGRLWNV